MNKSCIYILHDKRNLNIYCLLSLDFKLNVTDSIQMRIKYFQKFIFQFLETAGYNILKKFRLDQRLD